MTAHAQPRMIGILADVAKLAALYTEKETLADQLDEWITPRLPSRSSFQSQPDHPDDSDTIRDLEEACEGADLDFIRAIRKLLSRRGLARGLSSGVDQGLLSDEQAEQILAEASFIINASVRVDTQTGQEYERVLAGLPLLGEAVEEALASDPAGARSALIAGLAAPEVCVFPMSRAIHPLAWANTPIDERSALLDELATGLCGPITTSLLAEHDRILSQSLSSTDASWSDAASPLRVWPMLLERALEPDEDMALERALSDIGMQPVWQAWIEQVGGLDPSQAWAEAPMPMDEVLPYTLLAQTRALQQGDAAGRVHGDQDPVLVDVVHRTDPQGDRWVDLDLEYPNGESITLHLPLPWLGLTAWQRSDSLMRCQAAWGAGPKDAASNDDWAASEMILYLDPPALD